VLYIDVVKVDLDVAYTCKLQAYVSSVFGCFIRMFASVSSECCICLQWFSYIFQAFSQVFQTFVSSVSFIFFCILQLLHIDVSKIDRVLHMRCAWKVAGNADNIWGGAGPLLVRSLASPTRRSFAPSAQ
jgi:hypothetical protein